MQITIGGVSFDITEGNPSINERLDKIMSVATDLIAAQAAEKTEVDSLVKGMGQLLILVGNGTVSPAQATALGTEFAAETSSLKSVNASIASLIGPPVGP